jgi:putative ATPase
VSDLFGTPAAAPAPEAPLADRLRPQDLADVVGQGHLVGPDGFLTRTIAAGVPVSVLLWGPPGCGKTTLARLYARAFGAEFVALSAVLAGVADVRNVVAAAKEARRHGKRTVLFVDEIHRFNKAQQDAFLPFVEDGTLILVGATTENPSFALNNALLSRAHVLTLKPLDDTALEAILTRAERTLGPLPLTTDARRVLLALAQGDGRYLLGLAEAVRLSGKAMLDVPALEALVARRAALHDRDGEGHYNLISALHKAVRGSDPDAALYWFARMLDGGDDPLFLARRLIRMASEDIGLADPQALPVCIAARDAYHMLGSPEGELALAEAVIYLALAPKSNRTYVAFKAAKALAAQTNHLSPPAVILNAPTQLMKDLGYGHGYVYDPDTPEGFSGQNYFPDGMERPTLYTPVERGFERDMAKRIAYFATLRARKAGHG